MTSNKFDAAERVQTLEFDFSTYRPDPDAPDLDDAERDKRKAAADEAWLGTIPEPPDANINRLFQGALPDIRLETRQAMQRLVDGQTEARRAIWAEKHPDGPEPTDDDIEALDVGPDHARREQAEYADTVVASQEVARARTVAALAEFTQGHPSVLVLEYVPWRALQHFLGWLTGQFSPEGLAAAMTT